MGPISSSLLPSNSCFRKSRSRGEALATLCPIWPAQDLDLRPLVHEQYLGVYNLERIEHGVLKISSKHQFCFSLPTRMRTKTSWCSAQSLTSTFRSFSPMTSLSSAASHRTCSLASSCPSRTTHICWRPFKVCAMKIICRWRISWFLLKESFAQSISEIRIWFPKISPKKIRRIYQMYRLKMNKFPKFIFILFNKGIVFGFVGFFDFNSTKAFNRWASNWGWRLPLGARYVYLTLCNHLLRH